MASAVVSRADGPVRVVASYEETPPARLKLPFITAPYSEMAASFRLLRHRLQANGDPRIIGVTSPEREEGKTTCAVNLAMAFAEHGTDDVLLIEANHQHPALAESLGFAPPACFARQTAQYIEQPTPKLEAVAAYVYNLHVLAVNPNVSKPSILTGASFTRVMQALTAANYAKIVVDCASVFGSADVSIIQDTVDGLLFALRAGRSRSKSVRRAVDRLAPVNILGSVLMPE